MNLSDPQNILPNDPSALAPKIPNARVMVRIAAISEGALAAMALVLGELFGRPVLAQINWTLTALANGLLATVPPFVALVLITRYPAGPFARLQEVMRQQILPLFRNCNIWQLLLIACLAGFSEELLFRGFLQRGIENLTGFPWLALAVTSLLFGLLHPITPTYAIGAAVMGAYFGILLWASDNLLAPIVSHAAYDFAALVYLLRRETQNIEPV